MLLGYSSRYGGLLYIINVLKFFLVMNAKEFLGGLLEENKPQVVSFQNGAYVQVINLEAEEVAEYIRGLTKYQRLLLRTRISRHQMAAGYEASHLEGIGKQDIQRRILLSEFWKMLVKVAAPCFK